MIPLAEPLLGGNEGAYMQECLRTNYVSTVGAFVNRFEGEFAAFVDSPHAVACSSGTAALHVALRLAGAGPGVLVAVSDFTFVASANAVRYTGADLLLVDSEPGTWNMDTARLHDDVVARAASGRPVPQVVEVVHVLGHPADLEPLVALRDRFGIRIVEDAAESLGACYRTGPFAGRHVGTIGDFGCYSFNGNKVMTTGGGGMIVTTDAEAAGRARHLTTQARLPGVDYLHDEVGYNYRLSNIAAALGVAQLEQLPGFLARRRQHAVAYTGLLAGLPLDAPPSAPWAAPVHWLFSVLLREARPHAATVAWFADRGVQVRPLWLPVHAQPPYAGVECLGGQEATRLHRHGLSLPSSSSLTPEQRAQVAALVAEYLAAG